MHLHISNTADQWQDTSQTFNNQPENSKEINIMHISGFQVVKVNGMVPLVSSSSCGDSLLAFQRGFGVITNTHFRHNYKK